MAIMQRELRQPVVLARRPPRRWERTGAIVPLMLVILALWLAYSVIGFAIAWARVKYDDIRFGYPRTFQMDGYIGYRESSGLPTHFVAINAHRQVLILIVPGTNPSRVSVIKGPYLFGPNQDFSAATLDLRDVNHDGFADLLLHVAGQTITYLNDPSKHTFIAPKASTGATR